MWIYYVFNDLDIRTCTNFKHDLPNKADERNVNSKYLGQWKRTPDSFCKGPREIIIKDRIVFQSTLLLFHARFSGTFYSCGVTAKPRELSWQPSLWLRLDNSFQQHLLILLNHKCLLVLWARLTLPSSPHWPCCVCGTWMSSHESVQLILGHHQSQEYECGLHHRGEAQGQGSISNAHQIHFRSICDQTSFRD